MANRVMRVWTGSAWEQLIGYVVTGSSLAYYQGSQPSSVPTGTLWVNSSNGSLYYYDGASWNSLTMQGIVTDTGTQTLTNKSFTDVKTETSVNTQTASYAPVLSDAGKIIQMNVASANNLTVSPDSTTNFTIGTTINVVQIGTGQTTIVAGSGVTINSALGLKLNTQWASATLLKRSANNWLLYGDTTV